MNIFGTLNEKLLLWYKDFPNSKRLLENDNLLKNRNNNAQNINEGKPYIIYDIGEELLIYALIEKLILVTNKHNL